MIDSGVSVQIKILTSLSRYGSWNLLYDDWLHFSLLFLFLLQTHLVDLQDVIEARFGLNKNLFFAHDSRRIELTSFLRCCIVEWDILKVLIVLILLDLLNGHLFTLSWYDTLSAFDRFLTLNGFSFNMSQSRGLIQPFFGTSCRKSNSRLTDIINL